MLSWDTTDALAGAQAPAFVFDPDRLKIAWANRPAAVLWRADSPQALLARGFSDLTEASRIRVASTLRRLEARDPLSERFILHTSGEPVAVEAQLSRIRMPEGGTGILVQVRRTLTELDGDMLRSVEAIHQIRSAVSLYRSDGAAVMRNPAAIQAFGEAAGEPSDYRSTLARPGESPTLESLFADSRYEGRVAVRTTAGERWHYFCSRVMRDPLTGEPMLLADGVDITELVEAESLLREQESRLRALKEQAESANESKTRFLAAASHDLRQPLHALGMFVTLLRAQAGTPQLKELTEKIRSATGALSDLIDGLLDLSRLDAGVVRAEISDFPLEQVLSRLQAFEAQARDKSLNFRVSPSPLWVRSDPTLLERILINFVANALRYTQKGYVLVGTRQQGPRVRVMVADTGPGIPPEKQRSIFEEFVQLDRVSGGKGLGLGLAIVDRLGKLLDHPIGLTSSPGSGSTFWVDLPVVGAGPQRSFATTQQHAASRRLAGLLIGVVDDDDAVRDAVVAVLCSWGCEVIDAPDGASFVAKLASVNRRPDVLLTDYRLADGETGLDVLGRIEAQFRSRPVVALVTGSTEPEIAELARARNVPLLHKPLSPSRLYEALTGML